MFILFAIYKYLFNKLNLRYKKKVSLICYKIVCDICLIIFSHKDYKIIIQIIYSMRYLIS